jgi:hypothetical protein
MEKQGLLSLSRVKAGGIATQVMATSARGPDLGPQRYCMLWYPGKPDYRLIFGSASPIRLGLVFKAFKFILKGMQLQSLDLLQNIWLHCTQAHSSIPNHSFQVPVDSPAAALTWSPQSRTRHVELSAIPFLFRASLSGALI